jgi:hypothetical protein
MLDNWQVILFIKGVAQSGKSTIGNIAKQFYKSEDVSIMSSNIEGKFGLDVIADKMLYICFEVTRNWGLPKSDFQSIIVGEPVSIAGKNKPARTVEWDVPGLLLGNELGPWRDSSGSIVRRIVVAEFNNKIKKADTTLDQKLKEELPALLYKCYLAYKLMRSTCHEKGVWEVLPTYFTKIQKSIAIATNPIKQFLQDDDQIVFDDTLEVARATFESTVRAYLHERQVIFSRDEVGEALKEYGVTQTRKMGVIESQPHFGMFLTGIGLKGSREVLELEAKQYALGDPVPVPVESDEKWDETEEELDLQNETFLCRVTALLTAKLDMNVRKGVRAGTCCYQKANDPPSFMKRKRVEED